MAPQPVFDNASSHIKPLEPPQSHQPVSEFSPLRFENDAVRKMEKELLEKEAELVQYRRHNQVMSDSQTLAGKLKRDNEQLLEALHKE